MRFEFARIPTDPLETYRDLTRAAEELGFTRMWIPDHTFHPDPFVTLTACGMVAEHIELGVGITNPFTRHPVQIARAVATADRFLEGRVTLGLGAGNRPLTLNKLGLSGNAPAAHLREAVEIIRPLLAGESVTHDGQGGILRDVQLEEFAARPALPIYIASRGPAVLRVAGAVADGAIIESCLTPATARLAIEAVRQGAESSARDSDVDLLSWQPICVTKDRERGLDAFRWWAAMILGSSTARLAAAFDVSADRAGRIRESFAAGGPMAAAGLIEDVDVESTVIVGDAEECIDRIAALEDFGFRGCILISTEPLENTVQNMRTFAGSVMSRFA